MTSTSGGALCHARDAARFTTLVESASADDWERPSPVEARTALDVVAHLIGWPRGFLVGAGIDLPRLDVAADPAAAWRQHVADMQGILEDPAGLLLRNPHTRDRPVDVAIDQFYTPDVWMHTWDLAKALGREPDLGEQRCADMLAVLVPMEQLLRSSGQYGPAVPVPDDASSEDRLVGFIGRDPAWRP